MMKKVLYALVFVLALGMVQSSHMHAYAQYDDDDDSAIPAGPDLKPMEDTLTATEAEEQKLIFHQNKDWDQFWGRSSKGAELPPVDFTKYDLVVYVMGKQANAGYSAHIIDASEGNGSLNIKVVQCVPHSDDATGPLVPYDSKIITKSDKEPNWIVWKGMPGHKPCN